MQHTRNSSVLKISCAATMGIVAAVTTYLAEIFEQRRPGAKPKPASDDNSQRETR